MVASHNRDGKRDGDESAIMKADIPQQQGGNDGC